MRAQEEEKERIKAERAAREAQAKFSIDAEEESKGEQVRSSLGDIGNKRRIVDMTKEEREEQEKVWKLALQSIDQARHANAPGHEPNTSKPLSGANIGKISQIITQLEN